MRFLFSILLLSGLGWLTWVGYDARVTFIVRAEGPQPPQGIREATSTAVTVMASSSLAAVGALQAPLPAATSTELVIKEYTRDELLGMADDKYAKGVVPLGDDAYVTGAAKKGYVLLCNVRKDNPGAATLGPWIHGKTWNFLEKVSVAGSVAWPKATFSNKVGTSTRVISGNGLPVGHKTGVFPVADSDPASKYDKNPNTITVQRLRKQLPANPTYSTSTPYCMGGEVGIMLTGVPLFNAFDAGLRDAPAHELQDSCDGHPQITGQYHYHSLSSCFKDINVSTVLGYALDGFPITGPKVADKKFLTTEDLDECHGLTSEVVVDGKKKMTYHYVMTRDFPYSVGCFRSKPVSLTVIPGAAMQAPGGTPQSSMPQPPQGSTPMPPMGQNGAPPAPPQEAVVACKNHAASDTCSFTTQDGMKISGVCATPPGQTLACVPR